MNNLRKAIEEMFAEGEMERILNYEKTASAKAYMMGLISAMEMYGGKLPKGQALPLLNNCRSFELLKGLIVWLCKDKDGD
jgi:hypothetical protein